MAKRLHAAAARARRHPSLGVASILLVGGLAACSQGSEEATTRGEAALGSARALPITGAVKCWINGGSSTNIGHVRPTNTFEPALDYSLEVTPAQFPSLTVTALVIARPNQFIDFKATQGIPGNPNYAQDTPASGVAQVGGFGDSGPCTGDWSLPPGTVVPDGYLCRQVTFHPAASTPTPGAAGTRDLVTYQVFAPNETSGVASVVCSTGLLEDAPAGASGPVCIPPAAPNGSSCSCPAGYVLESVSFGTALRCEAPSCSGGQTWNGTSCQCAAGYQYVFHPITNRSECDPLPAAPPSSPWYDGGGGRWYAQFQTPIRVRGATNLSQVDFSSAAIRDQMWAACWLPSWGSPFVLHDSAGRAHTMKPLSGWLQSAGVYWENLANGATVDLGGGWYGFDETVLCSAEQER